MRRSICLFLCLLLALASLPARAEDAAQRYDFNGDGEADELRYSVADAVLTLRVGAASAEIALNDFSNSYTLALADLDASDAFVELIVGSEGHDGEYPPCTLWQVWRYDGSRLYPLAVATGAGGSDRLTQYGYAGSGIQPLKISGAGDVYVPGEGVIWIQPLMGEYVFSAYEEHYRLEGRTVLVCRKNNQFYPVLPGRPPWTMPGSPSAPRARSWRSTPAPTLVQARCTSPRARGLCPWRRRPRAGCACALRTARRAISGRSRAGMSASTLTDRAFSTWSMSIHRAGRTRTPLRKS